MPWCSHTFSSVPERVGSEQCRSNQRFCQWLRLAQGATSSQIDAMQIFWRVPLMMYKGRKAAHYIIFGNAITQILPRLHCTLTFTFLFAFHAALTSSLLFLFAIWLKLQSNFRRNHCWTSQHTHTQTNNVCVKSPNRFVTMNIKITSGFSFSLDAIFKMWTTYFHASK